MAPDGTPLTKTEMLLRDIEGKRESIHLEYWELATKTQSADDRSEGLRQIARHQADLKELLQRLWKLEE